MKLAIGNTQLRLRWHAGYTSSHVAGFDKTSGTKRWTPAASATAFPMVNKSTRRGQRNRYVSQIASMLPQTGLELLELIGKSGLLEAGVVSKWQKQCARGSTAQTIASAMVDAGAITDWHAGLLLEGKWKGFYVDHYCLWKLIETDTARGIQIFNAIDQRTGLPCILELVPPQRARTKSDGLFYIVRNAKET